jgi:hypothetical protein
MAKLMVYGGIYSTSPPNKPNQPLDARALNPLPDARMLQADSGDAGRDGYTVLSRASRRTGERYISGTEPEFLGPNLNED